MSTTTTDTDPTCSHCGNGTFGAAVCGVCLRDAEALLRRFAGMSRVEAYHDLAEERHGEKPTTEQLDAAEVELITARELLGLIGCGGGDEDVAAGLTIEPARVCFHCGEPIEGEAEVERGGEAFCDSDCCDDFTDAAVRRALSASASTDAWVERERAEAERVANIGPCECDDNAVPGAGAVEDGAGVAIERCDLCKRFPGDLEAAYAWAAATGGAWVVTDWEPEVPAYEGAVFAEGQTIRAYRAFEDAVADLHDRIGQPDGDGLAATRGQVDFVEPAEGVELVATGSRGERRTVVTEVQALAGLVAVFTMREQAAAACAGETTPDEDTDPDWTLDEAENHGAATAWGEAIAELSRVLAHAVRR